MLSTLARIFRPGATRQGTRRPPSLIYDTHFPHARHRVIVLADGGGATQRISFDLPLRRRRERGDVALSIFQESAISQASDVAGLLGSLEPTTVIASRFGGVGASQIVEYCKSTGTPLVAHFDDDLFNVPMSLGKAKYDRYQDPARQRNMRIVCEGSDYLYLSTEELKRRFQGYNFGREVKVGEIYCPFPETLKRGLSNKKIFGYMGTGGHNDDLKQILPSIEMVLHRMPEASFEVFGSIKMPSTLREKFGSRVRAIEATADYSAFLERMRTLDWMVGLAPLERNSFNDCKADTKFIEYVSAGILPVPAMGPVYARICSISGLPQLPNENWGERIYDLMARPYLESSRLLDDIQSRVSVHFSLAMLERQLEELLKLDS